MTANQREFNSPLGKHNENGNVLTYGEREYNWNTGRHLESITDGDNEYSYTYDENGIRTSKTVNGVTTYYNTKDGVILSQSDGTNTMYFQYDTNGVPLGFVYNGTQYLYMTNQMGDVISITDAQGKELVQYEYDEWGKTISVYLTEANNSEHNALADINPIRYRGYYYDTETGYYYLQSRYYDPSICRFINADLFAFLDLDSPVGINLYAYCLNNPINFSDFTGFYVIAEDEKTNNWFEAVLKTLVISIEIDSITRVFESVVKSVNKAFDFNKWFEDLSEINQEIVTDISLGMATLLNKVFSSAKDLIDFNKISNILQNKVYSEIGEFIFESFTSLGGSFFSLWETFADAFNGYRGGTYRGYQGLAVFLLNTSITVISIYFPTTSSTNILITTILTNAILDFHIDFENGHFWG